MKPQSCLATALLLLGALAVPVGIAEGPSTPTTTTLVLNAATPSNPIVSYTEGTEPLAEVRILNTEPMAGGFTITDQTGVARFINQFSNHEGVVFFFEVYWGTPHGDWTVTHKPGLPGISPQRQPGEPDDPAFDPASYASEVLLTFNIDPLRTPHKVAYETGEGAKGAVDPVLEPWRDESVGSILATGSETVKQEVREAQDKHPVAVDPVEPAEPLWDAVNDVVEGKYSGAGGAGGGTGGCADGCTDGGYSGGTSHYGPPGWSFCAYEDTYCSFSGTYDVAYGNQGYYDYAYSIQNGIMCSNNNFGDPVPGVNKACYIRPSGDVTYVGPVGYDWCNYEHLYCEFSGARDVAYGNHGYYYYQYGVTGGLQCDSNQFGDPYYGTQKACWSKPSDGNGGSGGPTYLGPADYDFCDYEGQYCSFTGTRDVAYGNHGYYYYRYAVSNGISCTNEEFGDPYHGAYKACYTRPTSGSSTGDPNCPPPSWGVVANNWKWINQVITHAPYGGHAVFMLDALVTTEEYHFGSGSTTQSITGEALGAVNGETAGLYKLMVASYYKKVNAGPSYCPPPPPSSEYRVVLSDAPQQDSHVAKLWGATRETDADDLTSFWAYSAVAGTNVESVKLYHQFQTRDNGRTVDSSTAESCRNVSSIDGNIQGVDLDITFTPPGSTIGVSGNMHHKTTKATSSSYRYCFGNNHSYDWDNLGGGPWDNDLAAAFHTNW